jgi:hypothetical protein
MSGAEDSSWGLLGEAIVAFAKRPKRGLPALPQGLRRIPGPVVVMAEQFIDSPVGPYLSLSIGEPVRLGLRPGYFFGTSVLNSADARKLGRQHWGIPHELGKLHWHSDAGVRSMEWDERGIQVIGETASRPIPIMVPLRTVQRRTDGPVVVPARLRAIARKCTVKIAMPVGDPLFGLTGPHHGYVLSGMVLKRKTARKALGLFSTLRAPSLGPEPGIANLDRPAQLRVRMIPDPH